LLIAYAGQGKKKLNGTDREEGVILNTMEEKERLHQLRSNEKLIEEEVEKEELTEEDVEKKELIEEDVEKKELIELQQTHSDEPVLKVRG